jgi:hypothetical protein
MTSEQQVGNSRKGSLIGNKDSPLPQQHERNQQRHEHRQHHRHRDGHQHQGARHHAADLERIKQGQGELLLRGVEWMEEWDELS